MINGIPTLPPISHLVFINSQKSLGRYLSGSDERLVAICLSAAEQVVCDGFICAAELEAEWQSDCFYLPDFFNQTTWGRREGFRGSKMKM